MELTNNQIEHLVYRFPKLELSYETFAHKKVSSNYDICISIPNGKKQFAWFTYFGSEDVCYLMDINKDNKVTKVVKIAINFHGKLSYGTILYGTLCDIDEKHVFIIEDIYYFCGLPIKQFTFGEKLTYFHTLMSTYVYNTSSSSILFALPYFSLITGDNKLLESLQFYESMITKTAYVSHHVQFRSSDTISPYLNHTYKKKQEQAIVYEPDVILFPRADLNYTSQSMLRTAVFRVTADIQNDVYHLFAFDSITNGYTYVNIAYIGTRKLSVYMNNLFRNIRENKNIDYGEESEDEDTFQNVNPDKYVDLKKEYKMNCIFHNKFKKWVPVNVVDSRCVNINELLQRQNINSYTSINQPKTNTYQPRTNTYPSINQPKTNTYQNTYQPKTNTYQNTYQPRTNTYQPKTNNYEPKTNTYQPKTNSYQPKTNSYQPKTNTYQPNTNSYQPKTNSYRTNNQSTNQ